MMGESSFRSNQSSDISEADMVIVKLPEDKLVEFKIPLPPKHIKRKKKVLDEETYVHNLGKIIERDFFPDLENLKDKVEFLDAHESNDVERLQSLYKKYSTGGRAPTPGSVIDSPATFDTPEPNAVQRKRKKVQSSPAPSEPNAGGAVGAPAAATVGAGTTNSKADDAESGTGDTALSLDEFLARNTSEDDDSFEQMMEDARQKYILKKAWMFNAEALHNAKYAPDLTMKALPANEHEARAKEKEDQSRPLTLENWKFKTFSSIMYVPDDHNISRARELQLAGRAHMEVVHPNTRFETNPFVKPLNHATVMEASAVQAIKKEGRIGVDGRELSKQTPKVRGYSFMADASPVPGAEGSPLITWGEVEGTPFMLDSGSTPLIHSSGAAPSYSMPKVPYRDVIALQLDEKANQAQRDKKSKALSAARSSLCSPLVAGRSVGSERWASERLASISPAARRLLSTGLGVRQNTDRTLRASYSPAPSFTPSPGGVGRSALRSSYAVFTTSPAAAAKPKVASARQLARSPSVARQRTPRASGTSCLTDGLLQLPKRNTNETVTSITSSRDNRKCAADFF